MAHDSWDCMRAGEETAWSLRAEIRTRVGSAALVLDGPGGERVLRAGLEGLAATTKLYPKTLAVRTLAALSSLPFPFTPRCSPSSFHQFHSDVMKLRRVSPQWPMCLQQFPHRSSSTVAQALRNYATDLGTGLVPTQVRAAVAAMGVVASEGTLVRTGGRLHPSPSFSVAPSEAEPEERDDEDGEGDDGADASAGDGAIAVAQLHRQVRLPGTPRLHPTMPGKQHSGAQRLFDISDRSRIVSGELSVPVCQVAEMTALN